MNLECTGFTDFKICQLVVTVQDMRQTITQYIKITKQN